MSSTWPPANFTDWPATRIAALAFNAAILALLLIRSTRRLFVLDPWTCCCHNDAHASSRRSNTCLMLTKAVVLGCVIGLFLHFIPCLWWTCDWGEHDGQGVRGAIWFVSWAVGGVAILWWECRRRDGRRGSASKESADDAHLSPSPVAA